MGTSLFQAICRMGIFMICAQAVVHFRPKEAYEKYLKLLVSVMVLIQVLLPVGSFLLGEGREGAVNALEQFGLELERSMREARQEAAASDEILKEMTLEEVMRLLEERQKEQETGDGEPGQKQDGDMLPRISEEENPQAGSGQEDRNAGREIEVDAIEPVVIEPISPGRDGQ